MRPEDYDRMEPFFPLRVFVCERCFLVQLRDYVGSEAIFGDYAYFSSYSDSWVRHAGRYVDAMCERFGLGPSSFVVEVASNDGYLLQHVVARGIPALGIEPARNVAEAARARGVPTLSVFLGEETARALVAGNGQADLVAANNVFAHVPDLHDFTVGLATLLAPGGVLTLEFPHLLRLIEENQFDTIYHEHFSYLSLHTARRALGAHGLEVFDVEELRSHGGSLRVYARHERTNGHGGPEASVAALLEREQAAGLETLGYYDAFAARVHETKRSLLEFLIGARRGGRSVVGYGAPGKGARSRRPSGRRTSRAPSWSRSSSRSTGCSCKRARTRSRRARAHLRRGPRRPRRLPGVPVAAVAGGRGRPRRRLPCRRPLRVAHPRPGLPPPVSP